MTSSSMVTPVSSTRRSSVCRVAPRGLNLLLAHHLVDSPPTISGPAQHELLCALHRRLDEPQEDPAHGLRLR
jgi:hypothetical protein